MELFEKGKWLKLSKIRYRDNWYQIFCNNVGVKTFLKIDHNNQYTYPELSAYISLTSLFNFESNGVFKDTNFDRTKILLSNYFKFTLGLTIFNYYNIKDNKYRLYKNNYKDFIFSSSKTLKKRQITKEEMNDYLDYNFDLNYIVENNLNINEDDKDYIRKFISKNKSEDFKYFAYNLKKLKIKYVDNLNVLGYYDMFNYEIVIKKEIEKKEEVLFHELRHMMKYVSIIDNNEIKYVDFKLNFSTSNIGYAFLEGLNSKLTDKNYYIPSITLNLIELIINEKEILEVEDSGTILDVCDKLASIYGTKEEALKLIMMMDDELTCYEHNIYYSKSSKIEMKKMIMKYYFEKISFNLLNINYKNIIKIINDFEKYKESFKHYLKFNYYYNPVDLDLNKDNNKVFDSKKEIVEFLRTFDDYYKEYILSFLNNYTLKNKRINKIDNSEIKEKLEGEGYIYTERQVYDGIYIINDENFLTERIKTNDPDIYVYDIYIKKDYLINSDIKDILEFISLDTYKSLLKDLKK